MNPIFVTSYSTDVIKFTRSIDFDVANEATIVIIFLDQTWRIEIKSKDPLLDFSDQDWIEIMSKWK